MSRPKHGAGAAAAVGYAGLLAAVAAGCSSGASGDPCSNVECSSEGRCIAALGMPYCACRAGFHPTRTLACEADNPADPCAGVHCDGHGACRVDAGRPWCACDDGYHHPLGIPLRCTADAVGDSGTCPPGSAEICNGMDDDCDGLTDRGFDLDFDPTNCGACGLVCNDGPNAVRFCELGMCTVICNPGWSDIDWDPENGCEAPCTPRTPADETVCEGHDDDCDGLTDEDWTTTVSCGEGLCERDAICFHGGQVCNPRVPPGFTDSTPDGIDEDCDGLTDEDCGADADADADAEAEADADADADADAGVEEDGADGETTFTDVPCSEAGDCNDGDPCTRDFCEGGTCGHQSRPSGFDCGDGICCSGTCVPGAECCNDDDCTAGGHCRPGTCDGSHVCQYRNAPDYTTLCPGGVCCGGVCRVFGNCCTNANCSDGDPCTTDVCQASFTCQSPPRPAPNATACTGGICCAGTCVAGAECCTDAECGCEGTATPCDALPTRETCVLQFGCEWDAAGPCEGTSTPCDALTSPDCAFFCGCTPGTPACSGTSPSCSTLPESGCGRCGCGWDPEGPCVNDPPPCASITSSSSDCTRVWGCSWTTCSGNRCV